MFADGVAETTMSQSPEVRAICSSCSDRRLPIPVARDGALTWRNARDKGADIGAIQTLLGHKTAAMARRYADQALDRHGARLYGAVLTDRLNDEESAWVESVGSRSQLYRVF